MSSSSQVLESTREIIQKLHRIGQTQEVISAVTGVDIEIVRQVVFQLDDPQLIQAMLAQAQQKSLRYRCSHSARLMRSPVQASNTKLYEKEVLEALLKSGQNELISEGSPLTELNYLKEDIRHFSKETLDLIEVCLVRMPEATLELVSDCLSVLSAESDLHSFLKVFMKLEKGQLPQLLGLLQSKCSAELMQSLYCRLAEIEQLQTTVLAMSKLLLRGNILDEAFGVFVGVVRRAAASSEVLDVALEVALSCSLTQLELLKVELSNKHWDSEQRRLDELSLREAEFRVKRGEDSAVRELLKAVKGNWAFKGKVLEFFDRVDWKQDKLEFLDEIYSRSLQTLKDQGLNPPLVEALETLYQITQTRPDSKATEFKENRAEIKVKEAPLVNLQEVSVNLRLVMKAAADELKVQQQTFDAQLQQVQRDSQAQLQDSAAKLQLQQRDTQAQLRQQQLDSQAQLQAVLDSVNQLTKNEQGFIYNFQYGTTNLHKTNLSTGQESSTALTHTFKQYSSLCETPEGNLFITGGKTTSEVVCINLTTHAVTPKPPMKTPRDRHGSVFYGGYLYVIGGHNGSDLAECERYDSFQDKWEPIAPLPHASRRHEAIVCGYTRRIYTFGGYNSTGYLDLIQDFELESQTWKILEVKLPSKNCDIPCFRVKNQALIYFIQDGVLRSFSPISYTLADVKPATNITSWNGPSYYAKGTLYYPYYAAGPVKKLVIGELVL
jgi:hypothetical protein